jgi:hypothetical protein
MQKYEGVDEMRRWRHLLQHMRGEDLMRLVTHVERRATSMRQRLGSM